jgi:hypothetical protein
MITDLIKQNVQIGDVLLSFNKKNILSKAITEISHSDFSHAFLYIGNGKILESSIEGVVIKDLSYYLDYDKYYVSLRRPSITLLEAEEMVRFCKTKLGISYGYLQMFYAWFLFTFQLRKNKWFMRVDLPGIVCSELVAEGLQHIKRYPFKDTSPANVTPADLAANLQKIV